jgi:hypothetical protein
VNVSVAALLLQQDAAEAEPGAPLAVALCARVPIWQPVNFASSSAHLGICLQLSIQPPFSSSSPASWQLLETTLSSGSTVLAAGNLSGSSSLPALGSWHSLSLALLDDSAEARLDGALVASIASGSGALHSSSGVVGLGTLWHTAHFDELALQPHSRALLPGFTPGSWLHDVLPGEQAWSNYSGWAGFVLALTAPGSSAIQVRALGRFRVRGNSRVHALDVLDAATLLSVLPGGQPVPVDLSPAGCPASDLLGFCYSEDLPEPAVLLPGHTYFVVSQETAGGDAFLAMSDAAAATTHVHRDGSTLMSYAGPGLGGVAGRVSGDHGQWAVESNIECAYGPLNLLMVV